jgi:peptide/nickel transport system permease protein
MWIYAARRVLYAIPIALGVSIICFALIYMAPGDPLSMVVPPSATQDDINYLKHLYGFDQPVYVQYLHWLVRALRGDLGISIQTNEAVVGAVFPAFFNTLVISLAAIVIAAIAAVALGALSAQRQGKLLDRVVTFFSIAGVSIPNYWLGILLIILFSVEYRLLPATGMGASGQALFNLGDPSQYVYAILPVLALTFVPLGIILRNTRAAVSHVLVQEFITTLVAKGMSRRAILRHAIRNAAPSIIAVVGLQFGYLVGGSILVETIFSWPGAGFLLNKAILTRDVPVLQGTILILAIWFIVLNLVVDLIQAAVDPRLARH